MAGYYTAAAKPLEVREGRRRVTKELSCPTRRAGVHERRFSAYVVWVPELRTRVRCDCGTSSLIHPGCMVGSSR